MLKYLILSMRPKQWIKNIVVFAALIFSQNLNRPDMIGSTAAVFFLFCLLAGGGYLINDLIDLESDRINPKKKDRPLASGKLKSSVAFAAGIVFILSAIAGAYALSALLALIFSVYAFSQIAYSLHLKNVVILDIFSIAFGFVLRVIAGAVAIEVPVSSWMLMCVILLSLFLALGKRRYEIVMFSKHSIDFRKVFKDYNIRLLDAMISVVTSATLVCYILYTMSEETIYKFHTANLKYTVPFVLYGIFRYLYLIYKEHEGGAPENVLFSDRSLLVNILLYAAAAVIILY